MKGLLQIPFLISLCHGILVRKNDGFNGIGDEVIETDIEDRDDLPYNIKMEDWSKLERNSSEKRNVVDSITGKQTKYIFVGFTSTVYRESGSCVVKNKISSQDFPNSF